MNDTNPTSRQKRILEIIASKPLSRSEIDEALKSSFAVSKVTLVRDLNNLIKNKFVVRTGLSKEARYCSPTNPLTNYFDVEKYFSEKSGQEKISPIRFDFNVFNNLHNLIDPVEVLNLSVQEKKLDPTIFRRELERFLIEFSWKSSKIEGNTYSLLETEILIKQSKEAPGHSKYEAVMILNHKYALEYILKNRGKFKVISSEKILDLHTVLIKDLGVSLGIRNHPVAIS
ncbi:hypothetical protein HY085_01370, partial [Candidatus Gottesmanbacteria bacterium]|nr:hypothetical protein [Candidatus Gottesmanbacteria bacterium]